MIKKLLVLVAMAGMILSDHSTVAQTRATKPRINKGTISSSQSTPALKRAPAKATRLDPFKYEFVTAPMTVGPSSYVEMSVLNCRNEGDEYVQIEIHNAAIDTPQAPAPQAGSLGASYKYNYSAKLYPSARLLRRSNLTKVPPGSTFVYWHIGKKDGTENFLYGHYYWVKIKASSENLIPKITHHSFQDSKQPETVDSESYLPGDFAVYTRDPFKRIR